MHLENLLISQQSQLDNLLLVLHKEQDLLVSGIVDGFKLGQLAETKQLALQEIDTLDNSRRALQVEYGYADDAIGSELAASAYHCVERWQDIQEKAQHAAHLNQLNGSLIQSRLSYNQRILDDLWLLAGKPLYNAAGQTRLASSRIQSKA